MSKKNRKVVTVDVEDADLALTELEVLNPQLARHAIARVALYAGVLLLKSDPDAIKKYWGTNQKALVKFA